MFLSNFVTLSPQVEKLHWQGLVPREIALQQEPSALAKRIAQVLDRPVDEEKVNDTAKDRSSEVLIRCLL